MEKKISVAGVQVSFSEIIDAEISKISLGENFRQDLKIDDLKASMSGPLGLMNPVILIEKGKKLQLIAGFRRMASAKSLLWKTIPARKISIPEEIELTEKDIIGLVRATENFQREQLTAFEQLEEIRSITKNKSKLITPHELAVGLGITDKRAYQLLKAANSTTKEVNDAIKNGVVSLTAAIELSKLTLETQDKLLSEMANTNQSIDAETVIRYMREKLRKLGSACFVETGKIEVCNKCLKRSDKQADLFSEETKDDAKCLDAECFDKMSVSFINEEIDRLKVIGCKIIDDSPKTEDSKVFALYLQDRIERKQLNIETFETFCAKCAKRIIWFNKENKPGLQIGARIDICKDPKCLSEYTGIKEISEVKQSKKLAKDGEDEISKEQKQEEKLAKKLQAHFSDTINKLLITECQKLINKSLSEKKQSKTIDTLAALRIMAQQNNKEVSLNYVISCIDADQDMKKDPYHMFDGALIAGEDKFNCVQKIEILSVICPDCLRNSALWTTKEALSLLDKKQLLEIADELPKELKEKFGSMKTTGKTPEEMVSKIIALLKKSNNFIPKIIRKLVLLEN